eukprot:Tamp_22431.p1 GENE.Tamp_22431~~Tamp_22431.p1  ORF type:complete len:154 (-),score=6.38 Tamp_22431:580-1041(-)
MPTRRRGASTLRTVPVPGYCGFVPGIASGNKHGMTYGALLTKDTIRSPSGQRQRTPESPGGGASPFGRATAIGLIREGAPVDVPVVGYMGFIPGFTSKNLHGGTYRSLLSTPSSPMGSPLRSPSPDRIYSPENTKQLRERERTRSSASRRSRN